MHPSDRVVYAVGAERLAEPWIVSPVSSGPDCFVGIMLRHPPSQPLRPSFCPGSTRVHGVLHGQPAALSHGPLRVPRQLRAEIAARPELDGLLRKVLTSLVSTSRTTGLSVLILNSRD